MPQWQCFSSFVFYIFVTLVPFAVWSWKYSSPRGVRLKCYYAFFQVCCGCYTSYLVSVHIQCQISIYTLSLCRGHSWRVRLAKQETPTPAGAGDSDSCRAPGLTSGLQGSVNVHRGAILLVPQWRCISSFVFYTFLFTFQTVVDSILIICLVLTSENQFAILTDYSIVIPTHIILYYVRVWVNNKTQLLLVI